MPTSRDTKTSFKYYKGKRQKGYFHLNFFIHTDVISPFIYVPIYLFLFYSKKNRLRYEFEEIQRKEDEAQDDSLKITSKMFRTVFTEIKAHIPFHSHPDMIQLLRLNGIDMGVHHFDPNGAKRMTQSMSAYMHKQLLQHMLSENLPFSIIID